MSEKETHILFLKEQVLRFASAIGHKHDSNDIDGLDSVYAKKNHADTNTDYGVGDTNKYGHVKVDNTVSDQSINPVQNKVIKKYIDDIKDAIDDTISGLQTKITLESIVNKSSTNTQIPSAKAVWDALENYKDILTGVALSRPESTSEDIDNIINPGYYKQTRYRTFSYGGETINYKNALIKVERQSNRIIQHVYATSKITSNGQTSYKINGSEYTRWGYTGESTGWKAWHVAHKPYTKTTRAKIDSTCKGVDTDSVVVYENTAGFIIHWDQYKQDNDRYPISAKLYEYATVCKFDPPLPIKGPYVFGNLIGRMDIKITSDKMQIRSTVSPGGRIIEMHETYFVPRNQ